MVTSEDILSEIFQININGINPKVQKQRIKLQTLSEIITESENKIPFFILTETHLKDYIFDAEVSIPDYTLLRADRDSRKNGGVAMYAHHTFSLDDTQTFTNKFCEATMAYNKQTGLVIIGIYKPPDAPVNKLKECPESIQSFKNKYKMQRH